MFDTRYRPYASTRNHFRFKEKIWTNEERCLEQVAAGNVNANNIHIEIWFTLNLNMYYSFACPRQYFVINAHHFFTKQNPIFDLNSCVPVRILEYQGLTKTENEFWFAEKCATIFFCLIDGPCHKSHLFRARNFRELIDFQFEAFTITEAIRLLDQPADFIIKAFHFICWNVQKQIIPSRLFRIVRAMLFHSEIPVFSASFILLSCWATYIFGITGFIFFSMKLFPRTKSTKSFEKL